MRRVTNTSIMLGSKVRGEERRISSPDTTFNSSTKSLRFGRIDAAGTRIGLGTPVVPEVCIR